MNYIVNETKRCKIKSEQRLRPQPGLIGRLRWTKTRKIVDGFRFLGFAAAEGEQHKAACFHQLLLSVNKHGQLARRKR
jgi:hypothetical protein